MSLAIADSDQANMTTAQRQRRPGHITPEHEPQPPTASSVPVDEAEEQPASTSAGGEVAANNDTVQVATPGTTSAPYETPSKASWYTTQKRLKAILSATAVVLGILLAAVALNSAYRSVVLANAGNSISQKDYELNAYDFCEGHTVRLSN